MITGMACGGAERQMAMLTSGLTGRGHEVRLAVLHGRDSFFELDPRVDVRYFECDTGRPEGKVSRVVARWRWLRDRLADDG
ncbi:MAG: glycosyltransferase family 4 protein, partial [Actinobacteria bacterium]|nr:glycosyltransferase family 4 protein [Actinomycetota bacterium]NIV85496.1 hypothetical protein [Actinomycetota bacterium]